MLTTEALVNELVEKHGKTRNALCLYYREL